MAHPQGSFWKRFAGAAVGWAPVWIPACLCLQFTLLGLRPALAERHLLDVQERALEERRDALEAERDELSVIRRAQEDPIYQERERRRLLDPEVPAGIR